MPGASLSTNPAVARDTPAAAATSRSVTRFSTISTLRLRFPPDDTGPPANRQRHAAPACPHRPPRSEETES